MNSFDDRLQLFNKITSFTDLFKFSGSACLNKKTFLQKILVENRIGSDSINGEVRKSCYPILCSHTNSRPNSRSTNCTCSNNSVNLALKKIPIYPGTPLIDPTKDLITDSKWTKYEVYAEIVCLQLVTFLVREGVCPNLPMFFAYFPCENCTFTNDVVNSNYKSIQQQISYRTGMSRKKQTASTSIIQRPPKNCILMLNELASGGDFKHWCTSASRSLEEWMCAYFQIFMGLAAIQKYYNMTHFDLHIGNVLVHNIPSGGYWLYTLNGRDYHLPNLGFLFVIWDFGYTYIPGEIEIRSQRTYRNERASQINNIKALDYSRIATAPFYALQNRIDVPRYMVSQFQRFIKRQLDVEDLIATIYEPTTLPEGQVILESYNLDKYIQLPLEYRKYLQFVPF